MLQIVPMAEKTEEAALLAKTEGAPDNGRVLVMTDGEETLGYVVVALEDDTLVFYGFSVSGQADFTKAKPDPMTTFRSSACCALLRMRPFKFSPAAVRLFPMCGSTPPAFRPDSF